MIRILMAAAWLGLSLAPAERADLSGTWKVLMPADSQRRPDGGKSDWKELRDTLAMTQKGDELHATWTSIDEWTLTGRAAGDGRFALESGVREIPMTVDGRKGTVPARWIIRGEMKEGALSGTAALIVGDREPFVHKWTAGRS